MSETKLFEVHACITCGVIWGLPFGYEARRREDKSAFYYPNGHSMSYTESEADQLRRERDRAKQALAQKDDEIAAKQREIDRQRDIALATERRLSAARGQITKIKNRASKGVCPCCNRHFTDLERHMATKHPAFTSEPDASEHVH